MNKINKEDNSGYFSPDLSKILPTLNDNCKIKQNQKIDMLFDSFMKCNIKFKNHFFFNNLNDDGFFVNGNISDDYFEFYKNVIDSDVGLILTGGFVVGVKNKNNTNYAVLKNQKNVKQKITDLTAYAHSRGAKIFMTLKSIYGRTNTDNKLFGIVSTSASFNTDVYDSNLLTMRVTDSELTRIANEFLYYAQMAIELNFDGILLDFSLDNLMGEMISPEFNRRMFGYYSSIFDFAKKVISNIKNVNRNLPVFVKYFGETFYNHVYQKTQKHIKTIKKHSNNCNNINIFAILKKLINLGADGFLFNFGAYETNFLTNYPSLIKGEIFDNFYVDLIQFFKDNNIKTNLGEDAVCLYFDNFELPSNVVKIVEKKGVDFIDVTKKLYADNNYLKNIKTQNIINPCIKCSYCNKLAKDFISVDCAVNPCTFMKSNSKTNNRLNTKVAVIGSGVSGLVTSNLLADRGFDVYLFEEQGKLNNRGELETVFNFDTQRKRFNDYLISKVKNYIKSNRIHLNLKTSFDVSKEYNEYSAVIVATGCHEKFLRVQGAVLKNVKNIYDVLSDKIKLLSHKRIVINAKSELSLKLALFLLLNKKRVTLLISDINLFFILPNSHYCYYFYSLKSLGAEVLINAHLKKIEEDFVDVVVDSKLYSKDFLSLALNLRNTKFSKGEKREKSIDADLVVYEPELTSNNKLYYELASKMYPGELYMVGSAFQIGDLASDIKSAYFVAKNL